MNTSFPPLTQFQGPRHFRLGTPSYVYPADILPNVEALAPFVDDIELVLFESGAPAERRRPTGARRQKPRKAAPPAADRAQEPAGVNSNIPDQAAIARLAELARRHNLTYTVHFPIDRQLGSPAIRERRALQEQMLAIIERTRPLRPFAYILHLEGLAPDSAPARVRTWQRDVAGLLPALVERAGDPALLCVENLAYPFAWCEPLLDAFGLGVCIDFGHLWIGGCDVDAHLRRHLHRARVIHLHGARAGRDHLALTALPPGRLRRTLDAIGKFRGVLTLEIFDYAAVKDSLTYLNQLRRP